MTALTLAELCVGLFFTSYALCHFTSLTPNSLSLKMSVPAKGLLHRVVAVTQ